MLSIFLTEELESYTAQTDNADVIFFFVMSYDPHNTALALLRGLIHQIIKKRPQLLKHALPYFTPGQTQVTLLSVDTLWLIFSKLITDAELGTMFCVLDGIEEGDKSIAEELLPKIISLLQGGTLPSVEVPRKSIFKLVMLSRDMPGLQDVPRITMPDLLDTLSETYTRTLLKIPLQHREASREILKWVTFAARPLRLQELAAAVRIQPPTEMAIEAIISLHSPLLKIQGWGRVTFAHESAQDYLQRELRDDHAVLEGFRLEPSRAHFDLAQACLDCIEQSDLSSRTDLKTESRQKSEKPEKSALLSYAVMEWHQHANHCSMFAAQLCDPARPFFEANSSARKFWWNKYTRGGVSNPSALYMACSSGALTWIEAILSKNHKETRSDHELANHQEDNYHVPEEVLKAAARNEENGAEVLWLLIERLGDSIQITEEVLKAAAGNTNAGGDVMDLLLNHQEDIQITEEIVEAAASNKAIGQEVISLLKRRQNAYHLRAQAQSTGSSLIEESLSHMASFTIFSSQEEKATEATSVSGPCAFSVFQSRKEAPEQDDNASVISQDTVDMTPEQDAEVILKFADALYEGTRHLDFPFDGSSMIHDTLLETKIKGFSQKVKDDNPRHSKERKPTRKVAKAIHRLSLDISRNFARKLFNDDLHSSGAESDSIPERPLLHFDIPQESMEEKIERLGHTDVESPTTVVETRHDQGYDSESSDSSDSLSPITHIRPDFESLYGYFKDHPAFGALILDIQQLMKHFHYDALDHIRHSVSQVTENASNSTLHSERIFEAQFHADWNLLRFLEERRAYGLNGDLGSALIITGNTQAAQLETVAQYLLQTWDVHCDALLPALQEAISGSHGKISISESFHVLSVSTFDLNALTAVPNSDDQSLDTRIVFTEGKVSASVTGPKDFLVAVAQQLAWLGATCRPREEQLPSETRQHPYYHDTILTQDNTELNEFRISYVKVLVDEDEASQSWTCLLDGPCIASGCPISVRSEDEAGLQLPSDFLGTKETALEVLTVRGTAPAGSSTKCFINGWGSYNFEKEFQSSEQPRSLIFLEQKLNSNISVLAYYRQSLMNLAKRHKQTGTEHRLPSSNKLPHVVSELLDTDPSSIDWSYGHAISFSNNLKSKFEDWTREEWDWWPFRHPQRALRSSEARLYWTCVCGEKRWAEVPADFAKRATRIAKACRLKIGRLAHSTPGQASAGTPSQAQPSIANPSSSNIAQSSSSQSQKVSGPGSPSNNPNIGCSSSTPISTPSSTLPSQHVFLLVTSGNDFRLAQIRVDNIETYKFFHELRRRYNSLRPFLRRWLSIWVYSHCDFYQCDKWEAYLYEPRREEFPNGVEYQYAPRPMDPMPPITPHQFYHRFHACYDPRPYFHFYHKCRSFNKFTRDHLRMIPKRELTIVEGSDKQEAFWGIFARERPSILRLLLYNFACALPCIIFFFMWLFSWGHSGDLQTASVPISVMLALLSVFWSIFFAHLEINQGDNRSRM
ncbi:hypothetical protein ACJQWK_08678 [Exserohilum turcicum]